MENYDIVRADFNEIAELPAPPNWNHNSCYFPYLLRHLPLPLETCLEIGCGQGELCALLAERAGQVVGIDLADRMIAAARRDHTLPNVEYRCENILNTHIGDCSQDAILTVATAHHLPFEWLLEFASAKLKPGGVFALLDLAEAETLSDRLLWNGFAVLPNLVMQLVKNGGIREDPRSAALWRKHGEHDHYLTVREVKRLAGIHLPGASVRRKLFWRYALIWEKPTGR